VHRPIELRKPGFLLPVVLWANGGCFRSDFTWAPLFERWASAGFVVLSLTDKTGAGGGGGNILDQLGAILAGQTTANDHRALIDWVVAQNESGPYQGLLDLEKIVIAGNSCGGVTAMEAAAQDDRIAAVFVLSGSSAVGSVNKEVVNAIHVPVGFIVGGEQDIAGPNALGDFEALSEGVAGLLVRRYEGDHVTVSTDPGIAPKIAEIALDWMDLALYGRREAYDRLTADNVCDSCAAAEWSIMDKALESLVK
jgi:dienelactone hydrolase